jgi:hypothetical protein
MLGDRVCIALARGCVLGHLGGGPHGSGFYQLIWVSNLTFAFSEDGVVHGVRGAIALL